MFSLFSNLIAKLPSVEQVEGPFKVIRVFLWNLFELVLLILAMIAIADEARTHVHVFREWVNPEPVMGAPGKPVNGTPPSEVPPQPRDEDHPKPASHPIIRVARRPFALPAIDRAPVETLPEIPAPPVMELAMAEYSNPIAAFELEAPRSRQHAVVRVIEAPFRGVRAVARRINSAFHGEDKSNNSSWVAVAAQ